MFSPLSARLSDLKSYKRILTNFLEGSGVTQERACDYILVVLRITIRVQEVI